MRNCAELLPSFFLVLIQTFFYLSIRVAKNWYSFLLPFRKKGVEWELCFNRLNERRIHHEQF